VRDADHDVICSVLIWLGDFNYRVDQSREDIEAAVAAGSYGPILKGDQVRARVTRARAHSLYVRAQLLQEKSKGRTFVGLTEAPITFAPTYKYDVGTKTYDTSEKARAPGNETCDVHAGVL
jgi:hypothetical protein